MLSPAWRAGWRVWAYHLGGLLWRSEVRKDGVKLLLILQRSYVHALAEKIERLCYDVVCEVTEVEVGKLARF